MDWEEYEITTKSVLELVGLSQKRSTTNHAQLPGPRVNYGSSSETWKILTPGVQIQRSSAQHHSTENQIQSSLRSGVPARQPQASPSSRAPFVTQMLFQRECGPGLLKIKVDRELGEICFCPKCVTLEGDSASLVASVFTSLNWGG